METQFLLSMEKFHQLPTMWCDFMCQIFLSVNAELQWWQDQLKTLSSVITRSIEKWRDENFIPKFHYTCPEKEKEIQEESNLFLMIQCISLYHNATSCSNSSSCSSSKEKNEDSYMNDFTFHYIILQLCTLIHFQISSNTPMLNFVSSHISFNRDTYPKQFVRFNWKISLLLPARLCHECLQTNEEKLKSVDSINKGNWSFLWHEKRWM